MKYFIDFEANAPTNEIIEIGCIDQNNRSFKTYIKSSTPLDSFVKKLTHIKESDLENAPEVDEAFKNYQKLLSAFIKDYGSYHFSCNDKFLDDVNKFLSNIFYF